MKSNKMMVIKKRIAVLGIVSIFLITVTSILLKSPVSQGQTEKSSTVKQHRVEFPVVDFSESEVATDPEERRAKNIYFDKNPSRKIQENSEVKIITQAESWIESLPAIPVNKSDVILIGSVKNSRAFLSKNRSNVYSEFEVSIDNIIFPKEKSSFQNNQIILVNREGGSVRFSSGHIQTYMLSGEGSLEIDKRYVMFLKRDSKLKDPLLITAYEINSERVHPVDDLANLPADKTNSLDTFLDEINKAILRSNQ